jgi:uncharacterized protein
MCTNQQNGFITYKQTKNKRARKRQKLKERNAKASDTLQTGIVYALEEILKDASRAKFTATGSCGCAG